jgi:hypothetical protein
MKLIALACAAALLIFAWFLWGKGTQPKVFDDGGVTLAVPPKTTDHPSFDVTKSLPVIIIAPPLPCTLDDIHRFAIRADGMCHTDDAVNAK